jgi:hypothetical protein
MTDPLPANQLESLLPALRHVAEWVQKNSKVKNTFKRGVM